MRLPKNTKVTAIDVVRVSDLPSHWNNKLNVRDTQPGMSKASKAMLDQLTKAPWDFLAKNKGIRVINNQFIVDGGTTYNACKVVPSDDAYVLVVHMSVPELNRREIESLAIALDTALAPRPENSINLLGGYDRLKEYLKYSVFADEISFKDGCYGVDDLPNTEGRSRLSVDKLLQFLAMVAAPPSTRRAVYASKTAYGRALPLDRISKRLVLDVLNLYFAVARHLGHPPHKNGNNGAFMALLAKTRGVFLSEEETVRQFLAVKETIRKGMRRTMLNQQQFLTAVYNWEA